MNARLRLGAAVVVSLLVAASCSSSETITGIVTHVDGDLQEVRTFTVVTGRSEALTFQPDPTVDYAFPLVHLNEHRTSLIPVTVLFEERDGVLVALAVGDAEGSEHRFGG